MNLRAALLLLFVFVMACAAATPPAVPSGSQLPADAPALSGAAQPAAAGGAPSEANAAVPVRAQDASWGSRTALVTIVEYSDFQCPYCKRAQPTLARIRAMYGPDAVRFVWKNSPLPFHPEARPAAEAAVGVLALGGREAFWRFHDLAFADQEALGREAYEKWAQQAGVKDLEAWRAGLAGGRWAAAVDADLADARALGVEGTPTFFVNGVPIVGAQPFEAFQSLVDEQTLAARAKLAAGVRPEQVYLELAKENRARGAAHPDDEPSDAEDTQTVFKIPLGNSPALGSPTALVTIVEFSDFQCPFCKRVQPTLKALREKYAGDLLLVWKNEPLPFHPWAEPAAQAALEARAERGDEGFWRVHDAIFAKQDDLSEDVLVHLAGDAGARTDAVRRAMKRHTHAGSIEADLDLADDFDANGTPQFFVNGRRLVGAQPQDKFETIIDEEIKRAKELVAKGTRPSDLYAELTKDGKGPPPPETRELPASLPSGDPSRGASHAKVIIHEWSDFQCPFCGRVEPTIARVMKEYGDRVKLVWHDLPLPIHADAALASQAAREALKQKGSAAFWAMHDKMLADQQKLKRQNLDDFAKELKLDMVQWKAALDGGVHADAIEADKKAAEEMGLRGTPGFVVAVGPRTAGYFLGGAQPYARFRRAVERALAEAK
jgi:protein-disulfide isomerase